MNNKMGFGSAPYLAHIGLMDATRVVQVEVRWPSGKTQIYNVQIGKLNVLDEDGQASIVGTAHFQVPH